MLLLLLLGLLLLLLLLFIVRAVVVYRFRCDVSTRGTSAISTAVIRDDEYDVIRRLRAQPARDV